jgi:hypothetical protein
MVVPSGLLILLLATVCLGFSFFCDCIVVLVTRYDTRPFRIVMSAAAHIPEFGIQASPISRPESIPTP